MLAQQSDYTATAQKDVVTVSKFLYKSNKTEIPCGCVCVMIYLKSDGKVALCSKLCVSTVSWLSQCVSAPAWSCCVRPFWVEPRIHTCLVITGNQQEVYFRSASPPLLHQSVTPSHHYCKYTINQWKAIPASALYFAFESTFSLSGHPALTVRTGHYGPSRHNPERTYQTGHCNRPTRVNVTVNQCKLISDKQGETLASCSVFPQPFLMSPFSVTQFLSHLMLSTGNWVGAGYSCCNACWFSSIVELASKNS